MKYYTQRNGLRNEIVKTFNIEASHYSLLFSCCKKYFNNLAWKYQTECPDGWGYCDVNMSEMELDLKFEIPNLFRNSRDEISSPVIHRNVFGDETIDEYDQFSLLDFIEFIANNIKDFEQKDFHKYFGHYHLFFKETDYVFDSFQEEINHIFEKTGLLYKLNDEKQIERIVDVSISLDEIERHIDKTDDQGLKDLIFEAIKYHKSIRPEEQKISIEKIWDAFERVKTYYTSLDKKESIKKIITDISNGNAGIFDLINNEYNTLTKIGNDYRIRHHERNKIDIYDIEHYDYLFDRCLCLINLTLKFLK